MRTDRVRLAFSGAAAVFAIGMLASGCSPTVGGSAVAGPPVRAPSVADATTTVPPGPAVATTGRGPVPPVVPKPVVPKPVVPKAVPSVKPSRSARPGAFPRPAHVVVVVEENHSPAAIRGHAPYLTSLERGGATLTDAFAEGHPSEPNYLALFSGSTHGLADDSCPHTYTGANLGSELIAAGLSFAGYASSMPSDGYRGCAFGTYARKHNPWVDFSNVPATDNLRFTRFPQGHFDALPRVSFVVPDLCGDMHDCDVATGDTWLRTNLGAYARWSGTHHSLLIVTFDEAEGGVPNRIPLIVYGQRVRPGTYPNRVDHYSVLRTLEDAYGLPCTANACRATPITGIWK